MYTIISTAAAAAAAATTTTTTTKEIQLHLNCNHHGTNGQLNSYIK